MSEISAAALDTHDLSIVDLINSLLASLVPVLLVQHSNTAFYDCIGHEEFSRASESLREPIEDELYFLAARDQVKFEHGHGWRLANGGEK